MIVGVNLTDNQLTFIKHNDDTPQQELIDCISGYIKCYHMMYHKLDCSMIAFATNNHVTANENGFIFLDNIKIGHLEIQSQRLTVYIPYHGNAEFPDVIKSTIEKYWNEIEPIQQAIIERMKFEFA